MSSKVKLILGSFLVFFLVLGVVMVLNLHRLEDNTSWIDHTHSRIHRLQKTYSDLKDVQANYLSYLLTHRSRFKNACQAGFEPLQKDLLEAEKNPPEDPLTDRQLGRLETLIEQKLASIQDGMAQVDAGHPGRALTRLQDPEGRSGDREIRSLIDEMIGTQIWFLKARRVFEDLSDRKDRSLLVGATLSALILFGLAFYLIDRQIKDKQRLLDSLRSNEEKFRSLAESAHDAFLITDEKGVIIDVNTGLQDLLGHTADELIGRPIGRALEIPGADQGTHFPEFLSRTLGARSSELIGLHKNGSRIPLEGTVSRWASHPGTFFAVVLRDITDRKFFIKTLLANEHRLFQFLDAIPVAVLVREPTGGVYFTNQKAKELFGASVANDPGPDPVPSSGQGLFRSSSGQPFPDHLLPAARALAGEKVHLDDLEFHRGSEIFFLEAWGTPILNEKGQVKFGLSAMIDVTSQKKTNESLREREEFFRNLFEEGPIGMILSLKDGTLVNVNRAFADMLGIPKRELLGRSFYDITVEKDRDPEKTLDQKLFDRILPKYQLEKRFVTRRGDILWCKVSASTIRDPNDEPLFRLSIIENITEQKDAEGALRESEERFRTLAESANDAIISADSQGRILFFNPSAERIFGYSALEAHGRAIAHLMTEESWKANQDLIHRYFSTGEPTLPGRLLELTGKRKDGSQFPAEISYFSWRTPGGLYFTSILRDITNRKQVEEMKDDLISVVSHQLKTPVAQINGYIENLLEGLVGPLTQPQREYLLEMREIGTENYRLISDLLSLSKIERDVLQVDLRPERIQEIVELTTRDYEDLIRNKGLEFASSGPAEEIRVLVDKDKTVEALRNILNNALKCTDQGSISVTWSVEKDHGVVEIRDTGIGMDSATLQNLFTKSQILGPEAGRAGAGLGLYIAKSFMERQDSDILVSSERGKGSRFQINLPLARP